MELLCPPLWPSLVEGPRNCLCTCLFGLILESRTNSAANRVDGRVFVLTIKTKSFRVKSGRKPAVHMQNHIPASSALLSVATFWNSKHSRNFGPPLKVGNARTELPFAALHIFTSSRHSLVTSITSGGSFLWFSSLLAQLLSCDT